MLEIASQPPMHGSVGNVLISPHGPSDIGGNQISCIENDAVK
jgi:hypothetical protein